MAYSVFDDKEHEPEDGEVADALSDTYRLWNELKSSMEETYKPLAANWGFAGKKWGWSLRLKQRARTVLYMTPRRDHFAVGFALGQKAVDAAHESDLPPSVIEVIDSARKYAEGRGVRLDVKTGDDLRNVIKVAAIKMAT